jgi:hypothetical protein
MFDTTFGLLLIALVVTFLAWRGVRRRDELARARAEAETPPRWNYRLAPHRDGDGRGYRLVDDDGAPLRRVDWRWGDDGLDVVAVELAGGAASDDPAFAPGNAVRLVPAGAADVAVRAETGDAVAGRVPPAAAAGLRQRLTSGELAEAVVLWETRELGRRSGLRLLLVHRETVVEEAD